jgi:hypothetical protein
MVCGRCAARMRAAATTATAATTAATTDLYFTLGRCGGSEGGVGASHRRCGRVAVRVLREAPGPAAEDGAGGRRRQRRGLVARGVGLRDGGGAGLGAVRRMACRHARDGVQLRIDGGGHASARHVLPRAIDKLGKHVVDDV